MVFQNYALYPYLSVFENIAFGLRARKVAEAETGKRVKNAAEMLGIGNLLQRYPRELSGGQRQRVAIGRAIVRDARLFLFDEPLSNLDAQLRDDMRAEIKRLHQDLKRTMIYVTHDQIEAMTLADRIVLLRDGIIEQQGSPLELFERPRTKFVAGFLGSPKMNFVPAAISKGAIQLKDGSKLQLPKGYPTGDRDILLGLRPQHLAIVKAPGGIPVAIELVQPTGSRVHITVPFGGSTIVVDTDTNKVPAPGDKIRIGIDMSHAVLIDPQSNNVIRQETRHAR
jgi:multiple sugar transport system ATP-binding protein